MTAGRPPKPSALKLVSGNPGKRATNSKEPEPLLLNKLTPPKHLAPASAAVWKQLAPMLRRNQVLTEMDVVALEMLCDSVADYRAAREKRNGNFTSYGAKGGQQLDQLLVAQQMCAKRAEGFMAKFGMDPVSRSRVMIEPQGDLFGDAPAPATGTSRFFSKP